MCSSDLLYPDTDHIVEPGRFVCGRQNSRQSSVGQEYDRRVLPAAGGVSLVAPTPVSLLPKPDVTPVSSDAFRDRGDAYYYSARNAESRAAFDGVAANRPLGEVTEVFIPGIFKRLYASDSQYGSPYITGGDVFELAPSSERYLVKKVAAEYRLLLRQGMIVVQEAGQLGGLIGRSVMVGRHLDGFSCSNNMIRIVPGNNIDS